MGASRRVSRQASDRRIFAEYSTPQPLAEDRSDEYFETPYLLAPNVKQRFLATLPGAVLAVGCWIGLSYLLGIYFRHFANFNKTYGTLGAAIALMVWLYWTGFAMLVGAELNAELAKISSEGKLQQKQEPPAITKSISPPEDQR